MSQLKPRKSNIILESRRKIIEYHDGAEGFIKWIEDYEVAVEVAKDGVKQWVPTPQLSRKPHPITGKTQWQMWEELKNVARQCLKMKNGRFVYQLLVLCWMRGEAKSAFVCLIVLWLFFNFPAQQIMLSANTKDQSVFVHYNIIANTIRNTPSLLEIVGNNNILDRKIRLLDRNKNEVSAIQPISSYIGILSNITCFTFSEFFKMNDARFFTELYGSIRNVPNALGLIDSTVAPLTHRLYKLYQNYITGKSKLTYFSYRCSLHADYRDFWNPEMTEDQLEEYKNNFSDQEYNMFFKNTWMAASEKMISPQMIDAMHYIGVGSGVGGHHLIMQTLDKVEEIKHDRNLPDYVKEERISKLKSPFIPTEKMYSLKTSYKMPRAATLEDLINIGDQYDTNFAILSGVDRADPYKSDHTAGARTIVSIIAKGLPGSKSNPLIETTSADATRYIYFLLRLYHVIHNDMDTIKRVLEEADTTYNGLNTLCTERAGMWDITEWCEENQVAGEIVAPSYVRQRDAFGELYALLREGRFKTPPLGVRGSREEDILCEELAVFEHDSKKKVYCSPEKTLKRGIQDDAIYSIVWGVYGGRTLTTADFRIRMKNQFFGAWYAPSKSSLVGDY